MTSREIADQKHAVIEAAKTMYKADGNDMEFEWCLSHMAETMLRPPLRWQVTNRNTGWALDIWNPLDTGDEI